MDRTTPIVVGPPICLLPSWFPIYCVTLLFPTPYLPWPTLQLLYCWFDPTVPHVVDSHWFPGGEGYLLYPTCSPTYRSAGSRLICVLFTFVGGWPLYCYCIVIQTGLLWPRCWLMTWHCYCCCSNSRPPIDFPVFPLLMDRPLFPLLNWPIPLPRWR